uniref:Palmitoyltransferase n=1 Tax=Panagrolaimus sp. JU765 TaxID=591449 RepID=A0AC34QTX1_9BILA
MSVSSDSFMSEFSVESFVSTTTFETTSGVITNTTTSDSMESVSETVYDFTPVQSPPKQRLGFHFYCWIIAFFFWHFDFYLFLIFFSHADSLSIMYMLFCFQFPWFMALTSLYWTVSTPRADYPSWCLIPTCFIGLPKNHETNEILADYAKRRLGSRVQYRKVGKNQLAVPLYCDRCQIFKAQHVHHCDRCNQCFGRMDHHCFGFGYCIHFHNHKAFLLFLFWSSILCITAIRFMAPELLPMAYRRWKTPAKSPIETLFFKIVFVGFINAFVGAVGLIKLQIKNWKMLSKNETTIESDENKRQPSVVKSLENIMVVMGSNPLLWFWPIPTSVGNGYNFSTK